MVNMDGNGKQWESQIGLYGMYEVQHRQIDVHLVNVGSPNNAFDYRLSQTTQIADHLVHVEFS